MRLAAWLPRRSWSGLQCTLVAACCVLALVPSFVLIIQNDWPGQGMWRATLRLGWVAYRDAFVALMFLAELLFVIAVLAGRRLRAVAPAVGFAALALLLGAVLNTALNHVAVHLMVDEIARFQNLVHGIPEAFGDRVGLMAERMFAPLLAPRPWLFGLLGFESAGTAIVLALEAALGAGLAALCFRWLRRKHDAAPDPPVWFARERLGALGWLTLPVLLQAAASMSAGERGERPNILLVSVDTLRADHLGAYGHAAPTSPALDALAREGLLFERAVSPSSWTLPSHTTMLTGLAPIEHRCNLVQGLALAPAVVTLAERLVDAGYRTAAVTASFFVSPIYALDQGFERWTYRQTDAGPLVEHAMREVLAPDDRPFFLFLHLFDPHDPYTPPQRWRERFLAPGEADDVDGHVDHSIERAGALRPGSRELRALQHLYEAEIAFTDERLGALFALLRRTGELDRTLVVFTADHGESFGENGVLGHGSTLLAQQTHVPLLLRYPARIPAGSRRGEVVDSARHLMSTVLDVAGVPLLEGAPRSLLGAALDEPAFGETSLGFVPLYAVQDGRWKLVAPLIEGELRADRAQLYDQEHDWANTTDVAAQHPDVVKALVEGPLARHLQKAGLAIGSAVSLTPLEIEQLRSLGYVH